MDYFIEAAFRYEIHTGKKSLDSYCRRARTVSDNGIKSVSDQLARDEVDHPKTFVLRYPGDEFDLLALVNSQSARDHPTVLVAAARDGHCANAMPWKSLFQRNTIVSNVYFNETSRSVRQTQQLM